MRYRRTELMRTELGQFTVTRLDGRNSKGKPYTIWISEDRQRMPLRLQVPTKHGVVAMELVEYVQ